MLVELRNKTAALDERIKKIKIQARSEGFKDREIDSLIEEQIKSISN